MNDSRTPIAITRGRFLAAVEQLAMGELAMAAPASESMRERALRVAAEWLTGLPEPEMLPEELARSVDGTRSWLPTLREADCSLRDIGVFICSVLGTAVLATQYEATEQIVADQRRRIAAPSAWEAVH